MAYRGLALGEFIFTRFFGYQTEIYRSEIQSQLPYLRIDSPRRVGMKVSSDFPGDTNLHLFNRPSAAGG